MILLLDETKIEQFGLNNIYLCRKSDLYVTWTNQSIHYSTKVDNPIPSLMLSEFLSEGNPFHGHQDEVKVVRIPQP